MHSLQLIVNQLVSLPAQAGMELVCHSGSAWLSHDGEDVVMQAGSRFQPRGDDLIVIEAIGSSRFSISYANSIVQLAAPKLAAAR